jgi:hypothetical protein
MTQLIETPTEPARQELEVLFKEARQRRRRRWLFGGIAMVGLTAGVIAAVVIPSATTTVRPPANGAPTATTSPTPPAAGKMADLVWAGSASRAVGSSSNATQLMLGDAVSGTVRRIGRPIMWCGDCAIVRAGNSLFTGEADGIYRLDGPRYRATKIANGQFVFPAAVPDQLFVASGSPVEPQGDGDNVNLITTTGKNLGGPWRAPQGYSITSPPRATTEGIVVQKVIAPISPSTPPTASPALAIWNPRTGSIGHVLDHGASLIDTTTADGHSTVAWLRELRGHCFNPGGDCQFVLTDLTTGLDRVIAPPRGLSFIGGGAFSPDGRTLAAFTLVHSNLTNDTMQLALIDVGTGQVSPVSNSRGQFGEPYGFATWSPNSQSVYFGGVGQIRASFQDLRIGAYRIGASSATALPFPVNYSAVAVNH